MFFLFFYFFLNFLIFFSSYFLIVQDCKVHSLINGDCLYSMNLAKTGQFKDKSMIYKCINIECMHICTSKQILT